MIKKQLGLTMIELMVSMMLGLGLIAGVGQLFVQSQKSFTLQRNFSDMTDDATFILESLAKGVLLAGFADNPSPALFPEDLNVLPVSGVPTINFGSGEYVHGTDTQLIFRYKLGYGVTVNGGAIISDACNFSSGSIRKGACELDNFVGTGALAGNKNDLVTVRIYKTNDTSTPPKPVFYSKSKIKSDIDGTVSVDDAQPLISEVEKLEFRYGIKNSANSFYYGKAADVTDWTKVFAVKVFLVMRSVDNKLTKNKLKYKIEDVEYTASDNRLYKVFSKTIFLRAPTQ